MIGLFYVEGLILPDLCTKLTLFWLAKNVLGMGSQTPEVSFRRVPFQSAPGSAAHGGGAGSGAAGAARGVPASAAALGRMAASLRVWLGTGGLV